MSSTETPTQESSDSTEIETSDSAPDWFRNSRGYEFVSGDDPDEIVSHSRLLAVAEFGFEAVKEADQTHHRLPAKISTPSAVVPVTASEHARHHASADEPYETPAQVFDRWDEEDNGPTSVIADDGRADGD